MIFSCGDRRQALRTRPPRRLARADFETLPQRRHKRWYQAHQPRQFCHGQQSGRSLRPLSRRLSTISARRSDHSSSRRLSIVRLGLGCNRAGPERRCLSRSIRGSLSFCWHRYMRPVQRQHPSRSFNRRVRERREQVGQRKNDQLPPLGKTRGSRRLLATTRRSSPERRSCPPTGAPYGPSRFPWS